MDIMLKAKEAEAGYIRIKKADYTNNNYIMHIVNSIGNEITDYETNIFINNLLENEVITNREAKLIKVATNDKVLQLDFDIKDIVRASIFKNMLINLI